MTETGSMTVESINLAETKKVKKYQNQTQQVLKCVSEVRLAEARVIWLKTEYLKDFVACCSKQATKTMCSWLSDMKKPRLHRALQKIKVETGAAPTLMQQHRLPLVN